MTPSDACPQIRERLPDLVDGLLDAPEAAAAEAHVAGCPSCGEALSRARAVAAAIATPWDVDAPPADLAQRAQAAALARAPHRHAMPVVSWGSVALRYGAAFAAGVVVALAVSRGHSETSPVAPDAVGPAVATPAPDAAPDALVASSSPRRIH